jgi:hypothetical protein
MKPWERFAEQPEQPAGPWARYASAEPKVETPADSVGAGEAALIAAGRGTDKIVQGVRQAYNWATGDESALAQMKADEAEKDRLFAPLAKARPVTTTIGQMAPNLAAGTLTGGASLLAGAAGAAIPSALSYGTPMERLSRAGVDALGGAGGVVLGRTVARVLKPSGVGTQAVPDTVTDAASRLGYKPTPAQLTQNPAMAGFENYLARSPGSSGRLQAVTQTNQTALNRAAAKAMGETADSLDEGVFAAAQNRIGGEFSRLGQVTKPDLQQGFLGALVKVDADNAARGSFANSKVDSLIDKGLDLAAQNKLSGTAYKEVRTELSNQAQAAFKSGDATVGQAYKQIVAALDDAAKGSLSKADQKAWDTARQQWAAFKTLSKGNVAEAGNVSAARVASAVRARGPQLRTGAASGELADIARIGEAFKSVPNPTSGQLTQQMLYGNPITGLPMMLGNKAAAAAYMSPMGQRYFTRGLLDVGQAGQEALGRSGALLGVPVARGLLGVE